MGGARTLEQRRLRSDTAARMSKQNPKVDAFVSRAKAWQGEMRRLRSILLECGLEEDLKWGKPCFAFEGKNVAIIQPFKEFCSLMFFKSALLEDTHGLLRSQGEKSRPRRGPGSPAKPRARR